MDNREVYLVPLKERLLLNKVGSDQACYHLVLDISKINCCYRAGDCIGIFPENHPYLVSSTLKNFGFSGDEKVSFDGKDYLLREFLTREANLSRLSSFIQYSDPVSPQEFASKLPPLLPRLYSISSSMKEVGKELHLLVKVVRYEEQGAIRLGTASSFLCTQAPLGSSLRIFFEKEKSFSLPIKPKPIIMIATGTGIAPFRAFMQERKESLEKNWLFFGERRKQLDFYFEDFWQELVQQKKMKIDLAFSRDENRCYVQEKMKEQAQELWHWIQSDAHIYVCGNANKMGKAVDATLHQIAIEQGGLDSAEAVAFLRQLRKSDRYLRSMY